MFNHYPHRYLLGKIDRRQLILGIAACTATAAWGAATLGTKPRVEVGLADVGRKKFLVSDYATGLKSVKHGIEAAIKASADEPHSIVDFEGIIYDVDAPVSVTTEGVTLANGGVSAGEHPALLILASDVTCERMRFARAQKSATLDSLPDRSCVVVKAKRFRSIECTYTDTNFACVYLAHGACNGTVIRRGSMTGGPSVQNACGIYAAGGPKGNSDLTIQGVHIYGLTDGILLFDTSDSLIQSNIVEALRLLPTVRLTGWINAGGNIWKQRTAPGTPGKGGSITDRDDGSTRVVRVNGASLGEIVDGDPYPEHNSASIYNGFVYINLGETDPNSQRITSDIVSGYAYTLYATGRNGQNEHLCSRNKFYDNTARDCDGFGIYFQLGNFPGAVQNEAKQNVLEDVCQAGVQHPGLPFAGLGVVGGSDTTLELNTVRRIGSPEAPAPGVCVFPGVANSDASGNIISTSVEAASANGFDICSSNWSLVGCRSHKNDGDGFRIWSATPGGQVGGVRLIGCASEDNSRHGYHVQGTDPEIKFVSAHIVDGSARNNKCAGIFLVASRDATVQDCSVTNMSIRDNGGDKYAQIAIHGKCAGTLIERCSITAEADGATGLAVGAAAIDTTIHANNYEITTPEDIR